MGYDNDPYRDENGEPLMDYDDREEERSPQPLNDDDLILDPEEDVRDFLRSQTPVHDDDVDEGSRSKPRKRLVKKSDRGGKGGGSGMLGLEDEDDDVAEEREEEYGGGSENRKRKEKSRGGEKRRDRGDGGKRFKGGGDRRRGEHHDGGDAEVKEMWDTIAGGDSEDDREAPRTMDDDNFIDDSGVDPADRYGNDDNRSPSHYPQAEEGEEDDEIKNLFKMGKKKKKNERSAAEVALLVENVMAELEVTAEEDAELNRLSKPAVNKLKKLPLLTEVLAKKQLQQEFLDHGVLNLLRTWLEPLPDGSLPNTNIRAAILRILTDFPIDLEQYDRREQLKKSGLGKVIMFLSKSSEETTSNRKLAKDLVDKWSRPIFNKSTRFEDMRNIEDERNLYRRPSVKKPSNRSGGMESRDDDLDMPKSSQDSKSGGSSSMSHASRPEAMSLDFIVRPQSKIDPDEVRARAKQVVQDQRRMKMNKKMQQMKAPKKKQLQATKLSVEGRGMVKYL